MPFSMSRAHASGCSPEPRGAFQRGAQHFAGDRRKQKPGADPRGQRHLVGVDDRVGEAADAGHDGDRAIAHRAELGQPARLEPRRDHERVGARLDLMRDALVVADDDADPSRLGGGGGAKAFLERRVARRQQHKLRADARQDVEVGEEKIEALLPREAADDADEQGVGIDFEAEIVPAAATLLTRRCASVSSVVVVLRSTDRLPGSTRQRRCRSKCR